MCPPAMTPAQPDLFADAAPGPALPQGFRYQPDVITPEAEAALLARIADLPFKPFEFHGYLGKRQVVSFGWRYDYSARAVGPAEPMPDFLLALREQAARFAGLEAGDLRQALVTQYAPGAGIGWHRDKPMFGEVVGISLGAPCTLRFRRAAPGGLWERRVVTPAPRSAYLLAGEARHVWEHSIPPVDQARHSITFRRYPADTAAAR